MEVVSSPVAMGALERLLPVMCTLVDRQGSRDCKGFSAPREIAYKRLCQSADELTGIHLHLVRSRTLLCMPAHVLLQSRRL